MYVYIVLKQKIPLFWSGIHMFLVHLFQHTTSRFTGVVK